MYEKPGKTEDSATATPRHPKPIGLAHNGPHTVSSHGLAAAQHLRPTVSASFPPSGHLRVLCQCPSPSHEVQVWLFHPTSLLSERLSSWPSLLSLPPITSSLHPALSRPVDGCLRHGSLYPTFLNHQLSAFHHHRLPFVNLGLFLPFSD